MPKLEVASHDPASHATNVIVVGAFPALVAALCHGSRTRTSSVSKNVIAFPFFSLAFPKHWVHLFLVLHLALAH